MRKIKFTTVLLFFFSAFQVMSAQTCESYIPDEHPDSRYTVHNNGTVTDTKTGLMWKVCSEGQIWNAGTCSGTATTYNWQATFERAKTVNTAGFAGHTDWRVPDIKELVSLLAPNCLNPAINIRIFPNTPGSEYWSSSPYAANSNISWLLNFYIGGNNSNRNNSNRVRLVRFLP